MKFRMSSLLACLSLAAAAPAFAHHSFAAEYDAAKPVTLTGTVTKVEWTNPHARFYINVKNDDGTMTNWNLELASPNYLKRAGWSSASLKEGDVVTVEGSLARSGANMANARAVTLADGHRVFARAATDNGG
jgi:DNA/RNA endonuclease YhcR with UshA esterase domain